jgi:hypothetical protein
MAIREGAIAGVACPGFDCIKARVKAEGVEEEDVDQELLKKVAWDLPTHRSAEKAHRRKEPGNPPFSTFFFSLATLPGTRPSAAQIIRQAHQSRSRVSSARPARIDDSGFENRRVTDTQPFHATCCCSSGRRKIDMPGIVGIDRCSPNHPASPPKSLACFVCTPSKNRRQRIRKPDLCRRRSRG